MNTFGDASGEEVGALSMRFREGLFTGKVAVISGAGRGIGRAMLVQFVRLGVRVAAHWPRPWTWVPMPWRWGQPVPTRS